MKVEDSMVTFENSLHLTNANDHNSTQPQWNEIVSKSCSAEVMHKMNKGRRDIKWLVTGLGDHMGKCRADFEGGHHMVLVKG